MICKKLKIKLHIALTDMWFCKLPRSCRNYCCFQKMVQLLNLMQIMLLAKLTNTSQRKACKQFQKKKFHRLIKILDFLKDMLILTNCLVPCMFKLTNVHYINLILIILPLCCFPFKIFPFLNKTEEYIHSW